MAQVMEFILNLLLIKGKFLTEKAAKTVREAIRRCLNYRSKLQVEYEKVTTIDFPYENMMEFVNYNAGEYTCESDNFVVTREIRCKLYDELARANKHRDFSPEQSKNQFETSEKPDPVKSTIAKVSQLKEIANTSENSKKLDSNNRPIINDYIIENLFAILKSQEVLFANINKLVVSLEKDNFDYVDQEKLEHIKRKLGACNEILSGARPSIFPDNIINDIIEEEITRCRFRHGDFLTSKEINLKRRQSEGLEVALEVLHKRQVTTRPIKAIVQETQTDVKADKDVEIQTVLKPEQENMYKVVDKDTKKSVEVKKVDSSVNQPIPASTITPEELHVVDSVLQKIKSSTTVVSKKENNAPSVDAAKTQSTSIIPAEENVAVPSKDEAKIQVKKSKSNEKIKYGRIRLIAEKNKNEKVNRQEIDKESRASSKLYLKKPDSEPAMKNSNAVVLDQAEKKKIIQQGTFGRPEFTIKRRTVTQKSVDNMNKLIEVNEQQFKKVEDSLWHSKTTMKYLSLKREYLNMCKCDFTNRRQFKQVEIKLAKKSIQDKSNEKMVVAVNEKTMKILDGKMMEIKEIQNVKRILSRNEKVKSVVDKQPKVEAKLKSILSKKEANILGQRLQESIPETKTQLPATSIIVVPNKEGKLVIEQFKKVEERLSKENKIKADAEKKEIKDKNVSKIPKPAAVKQETIKVTRPLTKISEADEKKPEIRPEKSLQKKKSLKNISSEQEIERKKAEVLSDNLQKMKEILEANRKGLEKDKVCSTKPSEEETKTESQLTKEAAKQFLLKGPEIFITPKDKPANEDKKSKTEDKIEDKSEKDKSKSNLHIKGDFSKHVERFIKVKKETPSSTQKQKVAPVQKTNVKHDMALVKTTPPKKLVSHLEIRHEAEVLRLNKKAFDELENSLHTIRFFVDKPLNKSGVKIISSTEKSKRKIDDPGKKNLSTKQIVPLEGGDMSLKTKSLDDCERTVSAVHSKTFIKRKRKLVGEVLHEVKQKAAKEMVKNVDGDNVVRDKSRTFLKSASEITYKKHKEKKSGFAVVPEKKSSSVPKFRTDNNEDKAVVPGDENKAKPSPMRRSTKSAMKRQQVLTILPKVEKKSEEPKKQKPKISVLETEEIKIIKAMQNTSDGGKNRVVINVTKKHVNYNPAKSSNKPKNTYSGNHSWKKAPFDRKINLVKWEEEDVKKFVNIFDD